LSEKVKWVSGWGLPKAKRSGMTAPSVRESPVSFTGAPRFGRCVEGEAVSAYRSRAV
jgi:hypothetical protein